MLIVGAPLLIPALVVGLGIALVQALTQVQEMTLTFVPKLAGIGAVLLIGGNWMMAMMTDHFHELLSRAPELIRL